MALPRVAAFTDTYLPTVNGVTYTVETWRDRWVARGGRMNVVYPRSEHEPGDGEHPVRSLPFPFYDGFRIGSPSVPRAVGDVDVVHAHTPFALGLAARRLSRTQSIPLVASYHTPTSEYATYVSSLRPVRSTVEGLATAYEKWYLRRADAVLAPSETTAGHIVDELGVDTRVEVLPNGVDIDFFRPVETAEFRARHGLPDGPLVGYTGRHGYEKRLEDIVRAAEGIDDVTLVFGGDGPAKSAVQAAASEADVDARFLGFLDREELPAFYSALDVFAFPSPVETQGLVALEANACGTPVVGVDSGALRTTVREGETGYRYAAGDLVAFSDGIERALTEYDALRENCLDRREATSVEHSVDRLAKIYRSVR